MTRFTTLACAIALPLTIAACTSMRRSTYTFPAAMREDVRTGFTAQAEKGRVLYEINCGVCHNKMIGGRKVVPDFTPEQLAGYEIRIGNSDHERSLGEDRVSAEELAMINVYLTYKTPSGVPQ